MVAAVFLSCIGLATATIMLRPSPITSYEDQIADALRQQRIAYQQIKLGERWPDRVNFQYGSNVFPYSYRFEVLLKDSSIANGWLTCAKLERSCSVDSTDLALHNIAARDFSSRPEVPLLSTFIGYLKQVFP